MISLNKLWKCLYFGLPTASIVLCAGCIKNADAPPQSLAAVPNAPSSSSTRRLASLSPTSTEFSLVWRDDLNGKLAANSISVATPAGPTLTDSYALSGISLSDTDRVAAIADLNGDGIVDVVVQTLDARPDQSLITAYIAQDATGTHWSPESLGAVDVGEQVVAAADVNGDGRMKLLFRSHLKSNLEAIYVRPLENNHLGNRINVGSGTVPLEWRCVGAAKRPGSGGTVVFHNRNPAGAIGSIAFWNIAADWSISGVTVSTQVHPELYDLVGVQALTQSSDLLLLFRDVKTSALLSRTVSPTGKATEWATIAPQTLSRFVLETGETAYREVNRNQTPYPSIAMPNGASYLDNAPKTLDLAESASLALEAMMRSMDKDDDYNMLWRGQLLDDVSWYLAGLVPQMNVKYLEAMPLLRWMSGNHANLDVDTKLWIHFARNITRQGIYLMPLRERAAGQYSVALRDGDYANIFNLLPQTRYLSALANYQRWMGHPVLPLELSGERVLAGVDSIAMKHSGYYDFFYGPNQFTAKDRFSKVTGYPGNLPGETPWEIPWGKISTQAGDNKPYEFSHVTDHSARTVHGPGDYFQTFGSALAGDLATNFSNWFVLGGSQMFANDGTFHPVGPGEQVMVGGSLVGAPHTSVRTKALLGILSNGIATQNRVLIQYVENAYRKFRNHPASHPEIGYFPEHLALGAHDHQQVETDEVAEMIFIAMGLAKALGKVEYYHDAERYLANQFIEAQMDADKLVSLKAFRTQAFAMGLHFPSTDDPNAPTTVPRTYNFLDTSGGPCRLRTYTLKVAGGTLTETSSLRCRLGILDDVLGSFASYATPWSWGRLTHDSAGNPKGAYYGVMNCCLANAALALFAAWDGMYERTNDGVRINLLVNRAAKELDVYSWVPYHGRVDVRSHPSLQPLSHYVEMLMPEWIPVGYTGVTVTDNNTNLVRNHTWKGAYIRFQLNPGEQLRVEFPMSDRFETIAIDTAEETAVPFRFRFRGNRVVDVTVNGAHLDLGVPFYAQYRSSILAGSNQWTPKPPGELLVPRNRYFKY